MIALKSVGASTGAAERHGGQEDRLEQKLLCIAQNLLLGYIQNPKLDVQLALKYVWLTARITTIIFSVIKQKV